MSVVIPKAELNEFSIPRVCVATGKQGPVTFQKVEFQWVPKWIAIFACAPLLYLIFFFVLRKTASGTLPFSDEAWANVKAARRNVALAAVGLIGGIFGGAVLAGVSKDLGPIVMLLAIIGGIAGIVVTSLRIRKVYPHATMVDDGAVTLNLPSPEAEQLIRAHLSSGVKKV